MEFDRGLYSRESSLGKLSWVRHALSQMTCKPAFYLITSRGVAGGYARRVPALAPYSNLHAIPVSPGCDTRTIKES